MIGIGISPNFGPILGTPIDPAVINYFTTGVITDPVEQAATIYFIAELKANGLYSAFDVINLRSPTSQAAALLNFVDLSSQTNTSAIFSSSGFQYNGTSSSINTKYNLAASTRATNTSLFLGAYLRSVPASGTNKSLFGVNDAAAANPFDITITATTTQTIRASAGTLTDAVTVVGGYTPNGVNFNSQLFSVSRISDSQVDYYLDDASIGQSLITATGTLSANNIFIGAKNNNGSATQFSSFQECMFLAGRGLIQSEMSILAVLVQNFQIALSRQVVAS